MRQACTFVCVMADGRMQLAASQPHSLCLFLYFNACWRILRSTTHTHACRLFVAVEGVYAKSIRKIYDYHLRFKSCTFEFRVLIILSCFKYMCIRHERIQI